MEYLPHQQRVIEERDQLEDKFNKLEQFFTTDIYKNLDSTNQELLSDQHLHMGEYLCVLDKRIKLF